jgi:serine/threonine protein kinase
LRVSFIIFLSDFSLELVYVPKLLNTNVDTSNNDQSNKDLWNIIKLFSSDRLSDYIKGNTIDFRKALKITRQILHMIKQIHNENVIHRDIQPKNILIRQETNTDKIDMALINFSTAWINNQSIEDFYHELGNSFYRMPQFEGQSTENEQNKTNQRLQQFQHSPTIDTSGVGAILFWMITGNEPKESQDIWGKTPHKLRDNPKLIEKKIYELTGKHQLL